jgi:hypothetical protein
MNDRNNRLRGAGFKAEALKDGGFSAAALRAANVPWSGLVRCGFAVHELKAIGAGAHDLKAAVSLLLCVLTFFKIRISGASRQRIPDDAQEYNSCFRPSLVLNILFIPLAASHALGIRTCSCPSFKPFNNRNNRVAMHYPNTSRPGTPALN